MRTDAQVAEEMHAPGVDAGESAIAFQRHVSPEKAEERVRDLITSVAASAVQTIQDACPKEIVQFCYSEAAAAWTTYETSANPGDVKAALRNVNSCLARNSNMLSPPCFDALIQALKLPPASAVLPPAPTTAGAGTKDERHGRGPHNSDDASPVHPKGRQPRDRGHQRFRHGDDDSDDNGRDRSGVHPLVWVVMLPFFVLGLFAAVKKGIKLVQTWHRHYLQQHHQLLSSTESSKQREDYAPLKTQEPS